MLNIAHRGASGCFPENTLKSFDAAVRAGADMCELDVHLSRDGIAVVIHDHTVDRTTDGSGRVASMTLAKLKRLDAGVRFSAEFRDERIPTLDEVFELTRDRCGLNLELKGAGVESKVCEAIRTHCAFSTSLVSSFDWDTLGRIRQAEPRVRIGLLASQWPARLLSAASGLKAQAIHPRHDIVTEDLCLAAHQRGFSVHTWTVDEPTVMRSLITDGVDGIMTNYPERLQGLLER